MTALEVRTIINTDIPDDEIEAYISMAVILLGELIPERTYSDTTTEELTRWAAAHLISVTKEKQAVSEKIGDVSVNYSNNFSEGLGATHYGQTLLLLDSKNLLSTDENQKRTPSFKAIQ
jgi:hypothetical protein